MSKPKEGKIITSGLTAAECYRRIYDWHKSNGKSQIAEKYPSSSSMGGYVSSYLTLLKSLPSPENVTSEDMCVVFNEVLTGLMEWSYREKDFDGVAMHEYARQGNSHCSGADLKKSALSRPRH